MTDPASGNRFPGARAARILPTFFVLCTTVSAGCAATETVDDRWPARWSTAGEAFGRLVVDIRLTDQCEIDPEFEIIETPALDVTREEIQSAIAALGSSRESDEVPDEILARINRQVFGQEATPERVISKDEYREFTDRVAALGPWPQKRTFHFGPMLVSCHLSLSGTLIRAERASLADDPAIVDIDDPSEEGPFRFVWDSGQ